MLENYQKIYDDPTFRELRRKKSVFSWSLTIVVLLIYFSFILVIAFAPELLAIPIKEGSVISLGIPLGALVIISSFLLTGIYVYRANHEFDLLNQDLIERYKNK